jgi:hypothetical protein
MEVPSMPRGNRTCSIDDCDTKRYAKGWCSKHYQRWRSHGDPHAKAPMGPKPKDINEMLDERHTKDGPPSLGSRCWPWSGAPDRDGYGRMGVSRVSKKAHRLMYERFRGAIPDGLVIDHLCRNTLCVNPMHMEPVSSVENVMRGNSPAARNARKTHCKRGHPFSGTNLHIPKEGQRKCRECSRAATRRWRARAKKAKAERDTALAALAAKETP